MTFGGLWRVKKYRRALASIPDELAGVALACVMFSSLPQKQRFCAAMRRIEGEGGFAGWGRWSAPARGARRRSRR